MKGNGRYLAVVLAFCIFGFMPIYWSVLSHVDSTVILFHRSLWIFFTLLPYFLWKSRLKKAYFIEIGTLIKKNWGSLLFSSGAISMNWLGYIYAINHGYVIEASLAYYISPILTIVLSLIFLKESMSIRQWISVAFVFLAIIYLLVAKGVFPKFALLIGISFAIYGILSRLMSFPALEKLAIETFIIVLFLSFFAVKPTVVYLDFINASLSTKYLLFFTGTVTMIPMLLYIQATKLLKFTTIGILGFILPTLILLLGFFYFKTPWELENIICMAFIWPSIGLYIFDLFKEKQTNSPVSGRI